MNRRDLGLIKLTQTVRGVKTVRSHIDHVVRSYSSNKAVQYSQQVRAIDFDLELISELVLEGDDGVAMNDLLLGKFEKDWLHNAKDTPNILDLAKAIIKNLDEIKDLLLNNPSGEAPSAPPKPPDPRVISRYLW
jgi:hypothetical protein